MMLRIILSLALGLSVFSAAEAAETAADPRTVKFVDNFLKTAVGDLTPDGIQHFMSLDPAALPEKHRRKMEARRLELLALRQSGQVKKAPLRMPEKDCEVDDKSKSKDARILIMAGYEELTEDELEFLKKKTECTEHDLMCEFTLQIVPVPGRKGRPATERRVFMHSKDPVMTMLGEYRNPQVGGNTNFFGQAMQPKCAK